MTEEINPKDVLPFLNHVAGAAGKLILSYSQGEFAIESKDTRSRGIDIVTDADKAAEDLILGAISREFPGHDILTEERKLEKTDARRLWVVDPLDGTVNFAHGYPAFCISIALMDRNRPVAGIIFDPLRNETFSALTGFGAFFNGALMRVSKRDVLTKSIVATGFPYDRGYSAINNLAEFCTIMPRMQGVRRGGSAAMDLAYVACARLDGFWELKLKPWDMAAGMLIVTEAGGKVTDRYGNPTDIYADNILSTNGLIHDQLIELLARAEKERDGLAHFVPENRL
jgi:myo-inositol-1(or 4)-monophosphatase